MDVKKRQPCRLLRLVLVSAALVVVLAALPQKGALAQGLGPTPGGLGVPGGEPTAPEEQQPQPDGAVTEEDGEEGSGSSCSGALGFVCSMVVNLLKGILDDVWNWFVEITKQAAESLAGLAMGLPSLQEEDTLLSEYNKMVDAAKPFLLVCVLLLGVMMMVQSANYNTAYAWQYGLPKIAFAFLALTFFPDFVAMVSEVATGVGARFAGESEAGGAIANILADTVLSGTAATLFTANPAIGALVAGILLLPTLAMIIFLLFASIVKNILFSILVITGPIAIVLYPVPGLSAVAGAWFRGVLACFLIPVLFSIEIAIGTMMINTPGLMIGTEATYVPVLGSILAVVMLWVMYKTPGKVVGWAFQGYGGEGVSET